MTADEFQIWLEQPGGRRMVLIEAVYDGGIEYIASGPFISRPTDTPPNQCYDELLTGAVEISAAVDRPLGVGGIELVNDGSLDSWLSRAWRGHPLRVYLGDARWPRDQFQLVIDGINGGIGMTDIAGVEFELYDRMGNLEAPLQADLLPDGTTSPLCLGEVFNCEAVRIDAATLRYKVSSVPVDSIVVRDKGVDITSNCVLDLSSGEFTLGAPPAGQITCDVVEPHKTLSQMAEFIAGRYGESVDSVNLAAFPNGAALGYYLRDQASGRRVLADLAASLGAFPRFDLLGRLQLVRLDLSGAPVLSIDDHEIVEGGLVQGEIQSPVTAVSLKYRKNWTSQSVDSLAGRVGDESDVELYSRDFAAVEVANVVSGYPLAQPSEVETYIVNEADARAECERRAAFRSVARQKWRLSGFLSSVSLALGDKLTVVYEGFGFGAGRDGTVVSIRKELSGDDVELELLI